MLYVFLVSFCVLAVLMLCCKTAGSSITIDLSVAASGSSFTTNPSRPAFVPTVSSTRSCTASISNYQLSVDVSSLPVLTQLSNVAESTSFYATVTLQLTYTGTSYSTSATLVIARVTYVFVVADMRLLSDWFLFRTVEAQRCVIPTALRPVITRLALPMAIAAPVPSLRLAWLELRPRMIRRMWLQHLRPVLRLQLTLRCRFPRTCLQYVCKPPRRIPNPPPTLRGA